MDYNVVSSYNEFLNQMESCGFNDNQITLEPSSSNHDSYQSPSPVLQSRPSSLTNLRNIIVDGNSPPKEDLLKWSKLKHSSPTQSDSHQQQLLNLNLHRDINSYYDDLTGLIYRIPFNHGNHDSQIHPPNKDSIASNRSSFTFLPDEYHNFFPSGISSSTPPPPLQRSSSPFKVDKEFILSPIMNGSGFLHPHKDFEDDDGYFSDENEEDFDDGYEDYENIDDEFNPIMPGLFPKMEINDDDTFMKFDKLPLTPSFVSK
ncbi:hypothetical protein DFJ63DRAFT_25583 [Scheffersomyces coipomensis]|uniref:uncharacterized protein n=1 Tax=Scheffersomyces coipomensis TaxID=1788519 RepID=UPI00315D1924